MKLVLARLSIKVIGDARSGSYESGCSIERVGGTDTGGCGDAGFEVVRDLNPTPIFPPEAEVFWVGAII